MTAAHRSAPALVLSMLVAAGLAAFAGCAAASPIAASGTVDDRAFAIEAPRLVAPSLNLDAGFESAAATSTQVSYAAVDRVVRVQVRAGDRVEAGQTLVQLDSGALAAGLDAARADSAVAHARPAVLAQAIRDAAETRADLLDKRTDVRSAITTLENKRKTVVAARATLAKKLKQVTALLPQLRSKLASVQTALGTLTAKRKTVVSAIATLKTNRAKVAAAAAQAQTGVDALDAALADLATKRTALQSTISALEDARDAAQQQLDELEAAGAAPDDPRVVAAQAAWDQATAGITAATTQLAAVEEGIAEATAKRKLAAEGLATAKAALAKLDAGLATATAGLKQIDAGLATARSGRSQLSAGIAKATAGRTQLIAASAKASVGQDKLDAALTKARDGLVAIDDGLEQLDDGARNLRNARTLATIAASASDLAVDRVQEARDAATVTAPKAGVVVSVARIGDVVAPGATLVMFRPDADTTVTTWLSPEQAAQTCVGASGSVIADWGVVYAAQVSHIGVLADYAPSSLATTEVHLTRAVPVTLTLDPGATPPPAGVGADVRIAGCAGGN